MWLVSWLDRMQWKKSSSVCICVTEWSIREPLKIRLWRHGNKELQIIIIIMKEGKAKIAVCKKNSCDVLECLLFQNSTVPSSVFSAFVYDGWCDSKSSINSGDKAADTIKIAEFYWSSPLNGSFPVLFSCLHSVHITPQQRQEVSIRVSKGCVFLLALYWFVLTLLSVSSADAPY